MRLNLFRDESAGGVFAFSTHVSGMNIPLVTGMCGVDFHKKRSRR